MHSLALKHFRQAGMRQGTIDIIHDMTVEEMAHLIGELEEFRRQIQAFLALQSASSKALARSNTTTAGGAN